MTNALVDCSVGACYWCGKKTEDLQFHHYVPVRGRRRSKRGKKINYNQFGAFVCKPCHKLLHAAFSTAQLVEMTRSKQRIAILSLLETAKKVAKK